MKQYFEKKLLDFESGSSGNELVLAEYEKELKIILPSDYKEIISELGYLAWHGNYVIGVSSDNECYDLLTITKNVRCRYNDYPKYAVPLNADYHMLVFDPENHVRITKAYLSSGESPSSFGSFTDYIASL